MRIFILPAFLLATLPVIAAPPLTFEEVDTDGDGLISADEAASVDGLEFNSADGDNDGTLTVDEYDIAIEKLSQLTGTSSPPSGAGFAAPATSSSPPAREPVPASGSGAAPPPDPTKP